jgi:hypothetical protein
MLAKDSKQLCVVDQNMKTMSFTELGLRACSVLILLFLTLSGLCLIPKASYDWIDSKGPIIGACIILVCSLVFSFKWAYKKVKG